jgi:hexosaminidase
VYTFLNRVVGELSSIFPSKKIHIGGDEAPLDNWKKCPQCQSVIRQQHLMSEQGLMSYFFKRVDKILHKYGKSPLIWYETDVPEYPSGSTMYLWRMGTAKKVLDSMQKKGFSLIASPGEYAYFDYPQWKGDIPQTDWMSTLTLKQVYQFDPGYGLPLTQSKFIIGVEACLWGEYVPNIERAFYMTYPRALALAEAGWSEMKNRSWVRFEQKLSAHLNWLLEHGINYRAPAEIYHR